MNTQSANGLFDTFVVYTETLVLSVLRQEYGILSFFLVSFTTVRVTQSNVSVL